MLRRSVAIGVTSVLTLGSLWLAPATAADGWSSRGIPLQNQVLLGATVADVEAFEAQEGGSLGVRRSFYAHSRVDKAVDCVRSDQSAGRIPWVSFIPPYSWERMASGDGDTWAANIAAQLGSTGKPVWIAIHQEPEKDGPVADWVAMQRHLSPIFRAYDNIAYTIILTGWNQFFSGRPQYSMDAMWPGREYVDILGVDTYNAYGVTNSDGSRNWGWRELKDYYAKINEWRTASGNQVPFAVAETGWSDAAAEVPQNFTAPNGKLVSTRGPGREWLARAFDDMKAAGGIALTYFNVPPGVNDKPEDHTFPIISEPKISAFAAVLRRSDRFGDVNAVPSPAPTPTTPSASEAGATGMQRRHDYNLRIRLKQGGRTVITRAALIDGSTLQLRRKTKRGWRVSGAAANVGRATVKLAGARPGVYRAVVRVSPEGKILAKSPRVKVRVRR